jgi:hypothetical protein
VIMKPMAYLSNIYFNIYPFMPAVLCMLYNCESREVVWYGLVHHTGKTDADIMHWYELFWILRSFLLTMSFSVTCNANVLIFCLDYCAVYLR